MGAIVGDNAEVCGLFPPRQFGPVDESHCIGGNASTVSNSAVR